MRRLLALGLVALAGCSATGTTYKDHPAHNEPVPANTARIVVFRLDRAQNSTVVAKVQLDKAEFGHLRESGFLVRDVSPGAHTLGVDLPMDAGACGLPLEIASGETGYFLVAPRSENMMARTPGSILETFSPTILGSLIGALATEAGAALESAGKKCGGPFSVVRILPAAAQAMLSDLRESTD
jgi:hypothetical protein